MEVGSNRVRIKDESEWVKIPNHHPAIIPLELYERVQEIFKRPKCVKKQVHSYLLRSKIFCGSCLHAMARYGKKGRHFVCTHSQADENAPCHGLSVEESALESAVYTVLKKQAQIILGADDVDADSIDVLSAKQAGYGQQISEIQEEKRKLFEQMVLHEVSEQEYKMKKIVLDAELTRVQEVQATLSTQLSQQQENEQIKNANRALAKKVVDASQLSAELVNMLIERVYVYPGQNIEIVWKVAGFGSGENNLQKNS